MVDIKQYNWNLIEAVSWKKYYYKGEKIDFLKKWKKGKEGGVGLKSAFGDVLRA